MSAENCRGTRRRGSDDIQDKLLVFGYASRIYANDERAEWIGKERHLIPHPADSQLLIDRYDCRLHLASTEALDIACISGENNQVRTGYNCPAELLEEEMCEEERYKDMHEDMKRLEQEEEEKQRRAEIAFNYDESCKETSSSSEEEIDEPFQPPENIKLPLGMNLPDTMKQNAVIERTATFVVAQGPQMEIVIKAKQRGNQDQFGFLEFDHPLNAYYKYISKLIREKKYAPKPHVQKRRPKLKKLRRLEEEKRLKEEQQEPKNDVDIGSNSSSDSESDTSGNYLHPLLMGGARKTDSGSSSPVIGPKTKEENEVSTKKQMQIRTDYKLGKADDMYSSLFKNLSDLVVTQTRVTQAAESKDEVTEKTKDLDKGDYYEWYLSFYGEPPPSNEQPTVIPPPPDIMPIVNNAAEYVARYGVQAEQILLGRHDLNIGFLCADGPYYGYYHSRIRYYQKLHTTYIQSQKMNKDEEVEQWNAVKQETDILRVCDVEQSHRSENDINEQTSKPFSDLLQAPPPPPPFMNRKMRRRGFHDPPRTPEPPVQNVAEVGVIDIDDQLSKVQSLPPPMDVDEQVGSASTSAKKVTSGPISFSLNIQKAEDKKAPKIVSAVKLGAYDDENGATEAVDVPPGVLNNIPPPGLTIPPPPVAPVPLSSGQLAIEGSAELQSERKLKARLFMEKILNEKRAAKLRAQNEEQLKRENELLKKYEEARASSTLQMTTKSKNKGDVSDVEVIFSTSAIDQLINSQIDKVINETFKQKKDSKHSKSHHHKKEKKKKRGGKHDDSRLMDEYSGRSGKRHKKYRGSSSSSDRKVSKRKKRKRRHRSRSNDDESR
ncbi:unnamed protein product [Litomosoides sigmodontis]|uniref:SURP motif domain-containing protein n=1 Tax=Litomosoides sigmodontis TaxID=42156 RepID=A0A3P6TQL0_LITSI|nr:unnamed protein product [Litomosoides sigmodontis]